MTLVLAALVVASGLLLFGISLVSYELVLAELDRQAVDGRADAFTLALFKKVIWLVRSIALSLAIAGIVLLRSKKLRERVSRFFDAAFCSIQQLRESIRAVLVEEERLHLAAVACILLIAAGLRIAFLDQPMRADETVTYQLFASKPLYLALSDYTYPNNHLFHTLLVRASVLLFGNHPWSIRLPALTVGVITVGVAYALVRVLFEKESALLAAALVATSPMLVDYSANGRGYAILALLFLALLLLADRLRRAHDAPAWLLFSLLLAVGLYTVPTFLYAYLAICAWLLFPRRRPGTLPWKQLVSRLSLWSVVAATFTLVLYTPVFFNTGLYTEEMSRFVASRSMAHVIRNLPQSALATWEDWIRGVPDILVAALLIGFAMSVFALFDKAKRPTVITLLAVAVVVPVLLAQRVVPPSRVWLFLLPTFLVEAATGLVYLVWRFGGERLLKSTLYPVVIVLLCVTLTIATLSSRAVVSFESVAQFKDAEEIALFLRDRVTERDWIIGFTPVDATVEYYYLYHGGFSDAVRWRRESPDRIFAVIKVPQQRLGSVLRARDLDLSRYQSRLIFRRPDALVAVLRPQDRNASVAPSQ